MLIALEIVLPFAAALAIRAAGKRNGRFGAYAGALTAAVLAALQLALIAGGGAELKVPFLEGLPLTFKAGGFSCAMGLIAAALWTAALIYSPAYFKAEEEREGESGGVKLASYYAFFTATLGAVEGVMLSGDFLTAFIFFEILSFTSFTWVIFERTSAARRAAETYLFTAVIGGLLLLTGLVLLYFQAGTLSFEGLAAFRSELINGGASGAASFGEATRNLLVSGLFILFGFGAKAGMYPLHIWLPKAHPISPSPASALLSGVLTKIGIFGILMESVYVMRGNAAFGAVVLVLGLITMLLGAVLALSSVHVKRTLACSSMSQIGFIITGIGTYVLQSAAGSAADAAAESEAAGAALAGTLLHMVNHSFCKSALFLLAGYVLMKAGRLKFNEVKGCLAGNCVLMAAFAVCALSMAGFTGLGGFVSKTLLHEGLSSLAAGSGAAALIKAAECVFILSGALTLAYMTKLFICLFIPENARAKGSCVPLTVTLTIAALSLVPIVMGVPSIALRAAAFMMGSSAITEAAVFTGESLLSAAITLGIGAAVYALFVRHFMISKEKKYLNLWPKNADLEERVYRPLLLKVLPAAGCALARPLAENWALKPLCRGLVFAGKFLGRCLDTGTDALIALIRRTVLKERPLKAPHGAEITRRETFLRVADDAVRPVLMNFSFALIVTLVGVAAIIALIVFLV